MWYTISKFFNKEKSLPNLTKEQALGLLSQQYQNPAVMRYYDARERYLMDSCVEHFIAGRPLKADRVAGQVIEVREFKQRMKSAYNVMKKLHDEKPLKKEQE